MRNFSAKETEWLQELDGIELAGFWQRAIAFAIDWTVVTIVFSALAMIGVGGWLGIRHLEGKSMPTEYHFPGTEAKPMEVQELPGGSKVQIVRGQDNELLHVVNKVIVPILYFGILLWQGKGRTPGKRMMKIRVVSIMHRHLSFWHCVERALGYGAAALELGFGFVQFFIHPYRRCAQDRLAETIVVTESSYQQMQHRLSHPLIPDGVVDAPPDGI